MHDERIATRVSSACDRCRRQKQRCDSFRPCRNCTNTRRQCVSSNANEGNELALSVERPAKRARTSYTAPRLQSHSSDVDTRTERSRSQPSPRPVDQTIVSEFATSESAIDVTRRVLQSQLSPQSRATFAIPGGEFRQRRASDNGYYAVEDLIGVRFPPQAITDKLIDVYFFTVHWFSLVVFEPNFRKRYNDIMSTGLATTGDRPFLLLVLMVLVMSCHYGRAVSDQELQQSNLNELRSRFLKVVRQNFMDLLDDESLEFVQICTLLGSYWLYWGKPRSSFTILGAAIKAAQAISLHRQASLRNLQNTQHTIEEQKRVWWTIYTWDRFASVVYGRPLGISDRDCDVLMPASFTEHIVDIQSGKATDVELSLYQTNLNRLYQIASPLLENIYAIRNPTDTSQGEMFTKVEKVSEAMSEWQNQLPEVLNLDNCPDTPSSASLCQKMHQLQALSLRLTYLNLTVIIHRPLLADRQYRPDDVHGEVDESQAINRPVSHTAKHIYETSFDQCLNAALSVSRLSQTKPNLIQLAGQTHLLSFLAMNTFTSSVVLFICALSDILSNSAQEAKRGLSRNLKTLKSLPHAGSLSSQCSMVVGDLIQMVLQKEKDEMLDGPLESEARTARHADPDFYEYDHQIKIPIETSRTNASRHPGQTSSNSLPYQATSSDYPTGNGLGSTMQELHRVLKDASNAHFNQLESTLQHTESADLNDMTPMGSGWPAGALWGNMQSMGDGTYGDDMNPFWMWDLGFDGGSGPS